MSRRWWIICILFLSITLQAQTAGDTLIVGSDEHGETYAEEARRIKDSTIYQGTQIKLDIFNPVYEAARSKGGVQDYEIAVNVRLKQRYYPTLELGYAQAKDSADGGHFSGKGGFLRLGVDINGLRKHPESPHALLVGIRIATAYQHYSLTEIQTNTPYWSMATIDFPDQRRADVWGEVVAGCQVKIAAGFYMGWAARLKILFTRKAKNDGPLPYYIPGFGYRDDTNWGLNYYLGYCF